MRLYGINDTLQIKSKQSDIFRILINFPSDCFQLVLNGFSGVFKVIPEK